MKQPSEEMKNPGGLKGRTKFTDKDVQRGYKKLESVDIIESPLNKRDMDSNPNKPKPLKPVNR